MTRTYLLSEYRDHLLRLCVLWRTKVSPIPYGGSQSDIWGPHEDELRQAAAYEITAHMDDVSAHNAAQITNDNNSDLSGEDEYYPAHDMDQYCDVVDLVEAAELSDAYHTIDYESPFEDASVAFATSQLPRPLSSPQKRQRTHGHHS